MAMTNAAVVRAVGQVELLFAILTSVFFFGERLGAREIIGITLLVAGILLLIVGLGLFFTNKSRAQTFPSDYSSDAAAFAQTTVPFEQRYEFDIPEEDAEKLKTVGDAIEYITEKKGAVASV